MLKFSLGRLYPPRHQLIIDFFRLKELREKVGQTNEDTLSEKRASQGPKHRDEGPRAEGWSQHVNKNASIEVFKAFFAPRHHHTSDEAPMETFSDNDQVSAGL